MMLGSLVYGGPDLGARPLLSELYCSIYFTHKKINSRMTIASCAFAIFYPIAHLRSVCLVDYGIGFHFPLHVESPQLLMTFGKHLYFR